MRQSEEARLEFDKEPGHDKLKVSALTACVRDEQSDTVCRRKRIRCWSKSLCMTTPRKIILVGELSEDNIKAHISV